MSLQETLALPPNNIIDERAKALLLINGCSQRRLSQLTERAVDKALKLKAASKRLVDIVDIQGCGEPNGFGCAISTIAFKLFKNPTRVATTTPLPPQSWALGSGKPQGQLIGAKIYSLLMRWRSDPTFEWRARVALAVPILEEALYRVANTREEEYISQQRLESYLEHVLLHFEAGHGLLLLQGTEPLRHPMRHTLESENSSYQQTIDACKVSGENALQRDTHPRGMTSAFKSESCTTLEAMELDQSMSRVSAQVQVMGSTPSKMRAAAGKTRLDCELRVGAPHSEENIPNVGARPHNKERAEMFSIGEHKPIKHDGIHHQNIVNARLGPRKTLGDMINMVLSNRLASGEDHLMMPSSSHSLVDRTTIQETLLSGDEHLSSERFSSQEIAEVVPVPPTHRSSLTAVTPPLPSLSTSSIAINAFPTSSTEAHLSSSSAPSHVSLSSLPQISDPSLSSSLPLSPSLPLKSDPPSSSRLISLSISSLSFPQLSDASLPSSLPLSSLPLSDPSASPLLLSASLPFTPDPCISSSLPMMSQPSLSSPSLSSLRPPPVSPSAYRAPDEFSYPPVLTTPLQAFAQHSHQMPLLVSEEWQQQQQQLFSTYGQPVQMQELGYEIEVQASATATTTGQETQLEAARSSSSSSTTLSLSLTPPPTVAEAMDEAAGGGRGAMRPPLSIFLAERDECKMKSIQTWEEPTEQMDPLCCICMVGLKGAAFIPCGHTFCRKCSRELWRGRGACPLCNRFITEILDVY